MVKIELVMRTFAAKSACAIFGAIFFLAALSPAQAASAYKNCDVLFATKKPPALKGVSVTPLCEENGDSQFFATGYSKFDNRGAWSAYRLDDDQVQDIIDLELKRPKVQFRQNAKLKKDGTYVQPVHGSYTGTEWDRGHLAPNGAMAWDESAQRASFTVSNIAPQKPLMNRNIWRCFEISIREWAAESTSTFVVVGAVGRKPERIVGDRDPRQVPISVPTHFVAMVYRVLPSGGPIALGVRVPNEEGHLDIKDFVISVSELEKRTGFDFKVPAAVANTEPNMNQWPTRLLIREFIAPPQEGGPDAQCPRAKP